MAAAPPQTQTTSSPKKTGFLHHESPFSKSHFIVFAILFGLAGGYVLWRTFAAGSVIATLEAEKMSLPAHASVISDSNASAGQAVKMTRRESAKASVTINSPVDNLTLKARASRCQRAWPKATVSVDGLKVLSTTVSSSSWHEYTISKTLNTGAHEITISYSDFSRSSYCYPTLYLDAAVFYGPNIVTAAPTITLSATPTSLSTGNASTLTWNSTNATGCTASGGWSGAKAVSGSASTGALNSSATYNLACSGPGGNASTNVTVTVVAQTPPPPPPPSGTVVPGAFFVSPSGSDSNNGAQSSPWKTLGKAMSALGAGQTAYLRAGTYEEAISGSCGTSFNTLTWKGNGSSSAPITILGYPGEEKQAIVKARLQLEGSWLKLGNMVIEHNNAYDGDTAACVGSRAIGIGGSDIEVSGLEIRNIGETGVLFHTSSLRGKALRNYIHDVGRENTNQDHGFYVQGSGHLIVNNVVVRPRGGYGIHLYSSPSNVIVAQNTVIGSKVRSGIIIDTTGTNIIVVNNITANNANYGILARKCASGCVYDNNLAYGNSSGATSGSGITNTLTGNPLFVNASADNYRLQSGSPAIGAAVASYSYTPDLDSIIRPVGTGPDLGAFER